jgi:NAD(P)-dependent dehydrogenase (short-subunit alcohol dehydrogenase family)
MTYDIAGKVALVTGASSGLGHHFALVLAKAGAHVAIVARRADRLKDLADEIAAAGGNALPVPIDITNVASIRAGVAAAEAALGPIAILVNNAGISRQARIEDFTEEDYDAVMTANLKGAFFTAQAIARRMIAQEIPGRIVNIASVGGLRTLGQQSVYCMSKAGMIQMTKNMAREWLRHGINVNALCPSYIEAGMAADFAPTEAGAKLIASLPRRRMGEPRDLDALLLLLCSGEASRFINGAAFVADDGLMAL